ncbi:hypothetical protein AAVH_18320 [Aphelenchoides avenae]|nr:hypothetical protein AAVH_18320 [Aphelenchus avenae]
MRFYLSSERPRRWQTKDNVVKSFKACGIDAIGGADDHLIHCLKKGNGIPNGLYEPTKAREAAESQELAEASRDSNSKNRTRTIPAMTFTVDVGTLLPNESLLQVHFTDYRTLVAGKRAGQRFLHLATKLSEELACRRSFLVTFYTKWITYEDVTIGARRSIRYETGNQTSLAAACRELAEVIELHAVDKLSFFENTWDMPGVHVTFEAAPALKYAKNLELYSRENSMRGASDGLTIKGDTEAFMCNFAALKAIRMGFDYGIFRQFSWTFLRQESARELRLVEFPWRWPENASRSVEEFVRYCATLPRHRGGEALELRFSHTHFPGAFGRRIIELLKVSQRVLTFRMTAREYADELRLDESDYTVDVHNATTLYTSDKAGIVVEVQGRSIVIQSTAGVPHKNTEGMKK